VRKKLATMRVGSPIRRIAKLSHSANTAHPPFRGAFGTSRATFSICRLLHVNCAVQITVGSEQSYRLDSRAPSTSVRSLKIWTNGCARGPEHLLGDLVEPDGKPAVIPYMDCQVTRCNTNNASYSIGKLSNYAAG
jgi:hypothetical protein